MTESEVIAELELLYAKSEGPEDAFTTRELAAMCGLNEKAMRQRLRAAMDAGRLEAMQVLRVNLAGTPQARPGYRLLPDPKADLSVA